MSSLYSPQALVAVFCWIPIVLYIFMRFPPQRAVVMSFIGAWLFLPILYYHLPGIPALTKMSATCYSILLATVIYDATRIASFKGSWLDLPMLIWCICPFVSSMANDLGPYDGFSAVVEQTMTWGVPYFLGRIYLNKLPALRQLAIGIFVGGLIYIPFCLLEIRISPQLHRIVYGYFARDDFSQTIRDGGYRPTVFMEHGLMVGGWIMAASLIGVWLWKSQSIKQLWDFHIKWLVVALLITMVLVKSMGALILLGVGILILLLAVWLRNAFPLLLLILAIMLHLFFAVNGNFIGDEMAISLSQGLPQERIASLEFRLNNEVKLSAKAREKMIFGWGGWGRSRVYDEWGKDVSVTDSLWIIVFGGNGLFGLVSLTTSLLLPVISFSRHYPARLWLNPKFAPAAAIAVLLTLYTIDCLLNAMPNPIYTLASGGIVGVSIREPIVRKKKVLVSKF